VISVHITSDLFAVILEVTKNTAEDGAVTCSIVDVRTLFGCVDREGSSSEVSFDSWLIIVRYESD
jgi:hypothetical protein